jgi:hypothetical protein
LAKLLFEPEWCDIKGQFSFRSHSLLEDVPKEAPVLEEHVRKFVERVATVLEAVCSDADAALLSPTILVRGVAKGALSAAADRARAGCKVLAREITKMTSAARVGVGVGLSDEKAAPSPARDDVDFFLNLIVELVDALSSDRRKVVTSQVWVCMLRPLSCITLKLPDPDAQGLAHHGH